MGTHFMHGNDPASLDNHFRYLSGLLLAVGMAFFSSIPSIELHTSRVQLLTAIVVTGGACRLIGVLLTGVIHGDAVFALIMELLVTPLLCLWQGRLAKRMKG